MIQALGKLGLNLLAYLVIFLGHNTPLVLACSGKDSGGNSFGSGSGYGSRVGSRSGSSSAPGAGGFAQSDNGNA